MEGPLSGLEASALVTVISTNRTRIPDVIIITKWLVVPRKRCAKND